MTDSSDQEKKKRAAKRYPYTCDAECSVGDQRHIIKILNISTSGIQFAARAKLESKSEVLIRWRDLKFGAFSPTFLLTREIQNPESSEFGFYYGAQYSNLSAGTKESLVKLLKLLKDESEKTIKKEVEKITPGYLFAVIDQGPFFIKTTLSSGTVSPYFDSMFKEIKDYERESFLKDTDFTRLVQAMATYNFHCNLLKSMVPVVAETYELQPRFFQLIQDELQKIDQAIEITNDETKKILDSALSVEEKENLERQLTETGNRLYYTIQGMLQSVVEVFQPIVTELSDFKPAFDEIKQQYDQIAKPTHAGTAKTSTYVRRSKRPEEFSRANVILEAQLPTSKNRGFLYFMIFIFLVIGGVFAFVQYDSLSRRNALAEAINIGIEIKTFEKQGSQIDIIVAEEEWKKIDDVKKTEVYNKIAAYLEKEKNASTVVLLNEKRNIIKVILKGKTPNVL